ncbi:MAG: ferredoxin [Thermoplasmata archaeon]|nr:MAG: ferredoxin [Thermoplasmata archaeon]
MASKKVRHNADKCMLCGGCVAVCPANAITLYETVLVVDEDACIGCGECVRVCPMGAMEL